MKKIIFIFMILFLLTSLVYADRIELNLIEENNKASPGEEAVFELSIKNNGIAEDTFKIIPDEFSSYPFSDVFEHINVDPSRVVVGSNQEKTVDIRVKILEEAIPNKNYKTFVDVISESDKNIKQRQELIVNIVYPEQIVGITTNFKNKIVAGKGVFFDIILSNKVNKVYKNVEVFVVSELFEDEFETPLYYGVPIVKTIDLDLDPATTAGEYTLDIKVYSNKELIGSYKKEFEVIKNPDVQEEIIKNNDLFVNRVKITKTNIGNLIAKESYRMEVGGFASYFTTFNVPPSKIVDDTFVWNFEIMPGQDYVLEITTDYRGLWIAILVALVVFGLILYLLSRKITIKKTTYKLSETKEGVSELKVLLHVRNNNGMLKNVKVIDYLPNLVIPTRDFGTLKPDKIQKGRSGMRLIWQLNVLEAGEERVFSYKIKSKLNIIGKFMLPSAVVVYKKKGKEIKEYSKRIPGIPI